MGRGIINISLAALPGILKLSNEYRAISAYYSWHEEKISILVENEDIPEVEEGQPFPVVTPIYRKENGKAKLDHIEVQECLQLD